MNSRLRADAGKVCAEFVFCPLTLFLRIENVPLLLSYLAIRVFGNSCFLLQSSIFWRGILFVQDAHLAFSSHAEAPAVDSPLDQLLDHLQVDVAVCFNHGLGLSGSMLTNWYHSSRRTRWSCRNMWTNLCPDFNACGKIMQIIHRKTPNRGGYYPPS